MKSHISSINLFLPFLYRPASPCPKRHQDAILRHSLHAFATRHHWSIVLMMLDTRPSLLNSFCPSSDATLVMKAAEQGRINILEALKSRGADLSLKNKAELNVFDYALHHAEVFTIAKVVSWLKGNTNSSFKDPMFYQESYPRPALVTLS